MCCTSHLEEVAHPTSFLHYEFCLGGEMQYPSVSRFFAKVWQQSRPPDHCLAKRTLVYLECPAKVGCCGYRCAARSRKGLPLALSINVPYASIPTAVFKSATASTNMLHNESSSLVLFIVGAATIYFALVCADGDRQRVFRSREFAMGLSVSSIFLVPFKSSI